MTEAERIIWVLLVVSAWLALCWYFVRRPQSTSLATAIVGGAEQPGLLIAYASQSGSAAALAQCCLQLLGGASVARLLPLNQVTDDILSSSRRALFVASTYGEGEPPDNGIAFARRLAAAPAASARAGRKDSSSGRQMVAPSPRRTVRRVMGCVVFIGCYFEVKALL